MSNTKITNVVRVGIDIAKDVFQIHAVDRHGKDIIKQKISRHKLLEFTAQLPPCLIGMEACSGSHYWGKEFQKQGHNVKLMAGHRVKPYVSSSNKDDKVDAAAICEAVGRPSMKFVECKSIEQLEIQALHRQREHLKKLLTSLSNQMRGILLEHGIAIPKGIENISKRMPSIIEDAEKPLSMLTRTMIKSTYELFTDIQKRACEVDDSLKNICKSNEICKRISKIPGIGPVSATALYAAIGNGRQFKNGREAAAWLGIIPRHKGSGGKTFNGRLSKRGNRYIKTLAIQGGRSVLNAARYHDTTRAKYLQSIVLKKGNNIAAVACAHKNIRIAWVLMARGQEYKSAA
ncbi:MAG: IS110 family transposase [Bacteroidota bacterium]|nr:IS110 family transposase [Bacteroidota bacterium]